ncbi:MAG: YtxH domain-containing protein [Acidobacteria bacterium]|nr:YtxH domain-containing protein [Acidobacteriota bacterium]
MASKGDKFVYFLVGGFVGASVALLLAPKTGEQAREFLGNKYKAGTDGLTEKFREGREFVTDKSLAMTDQVNERINQGKDLLQQHKEQASAAIAAGKEAYARERTALDNVGDGKKSKKKSVS